MENQTPKVNPVLSFILGLVIVVLVVAVLNWGWGSISNDDSPTTSSETDGSKEDVRAEFACTHFRNILSDVQAGIYTDAELRTKLQEVYDDARYSTARGIGPNAEQMLRGITTGDQDVLMSGVAEFSASCDELGF